MGNLSHVEKASSTSEVAPTEAMMEKNAELAAALHGQFAEQAVKPPKLSRRSFLKAMGLAGVMALTGATRGDPRPEPTPEQLQAQEAQKLKELYRTFSNERGNILLQKVGPDGKKFIKDENVARLRYSAVELCSSLFKYAAQYPNATLPLAQELQVVHNFTAPTSRETTRKEGPRTFSHQIFQTKEKHLFATKPDNSEMNYSTVLSNISENPQDFHPVNAQDALGSNQILETRNIESNLGYEEKILRNDPERISEPLRQKLIAFLLKRDITFFRNAPENGQAIMTTITPEELQSLKITKLWSISRTNLLQLRMDPEELQEISKQGKHLTHSIEGKASLRMVLEDILRLEVEIKVQENGKLITQKGYFDMSAFSQEAPIISHLQSLSEPQPFTTAVTVKVPLGVVKKDSLSILWYQNDPEALPLMNEFLAALKD